MMVSSSKGGAGDGFRPGLRSPVHHFAAADMSFAHRIAQLADRAAERPSYHQPPNDPIVLREQIRLRYDDLQFGAIASYCWAHGLVIIPLVRHGPSGAGCWLLESRPVIVVEEAPSAHDSRWAFALGRQLAYLLDSVPSNPHANVGPSPSSDLCLDDTAANWFSARLQLGDPDRLASVVWEGARLSAHALWREVLEVAGREQVDPDALAAAVASYLQSTHVATGPWGCVPRRESGGPPAWARGRQLLLEHLRWDRLSHEDADTLANAIDETQECPPPPAEAQP
jgi:hypothetical protein